MREELTSDCPVCGQPAEPREFCYPAVTPVAELTVEMVELLPEEELWGMAIYELRKEQEWRTGQETHRPRPYHGIMVDPGPYRDLSDYWPEELTRMAYLGPSWDDV